jgi:hypothetical protein
MTKEVSVAVQQHAGQIADVISMKATVQDLLKSQMQEDVHFGKIPGTGDKPTLLKSGAEMLRMVFNLRTTCNKDDVEITNEGNGHKTYEICMHISNKDKEIIATGLGACSTMESKYKYRSQLTDRKVPSEYWESRDKALLGGSQYSPKKVKGAWLISERVEHDNPADYYNTVKKMAKKRAMADGILTATCSSDLFTQDLEDLNANFKQYDGVETEEKKTPNYQQENKVEGHPSTDKQDTTTINSEAVANASPSQQVKEWEQQADPESDSDKVKLVEQIQEKLHDDPLPIPVSLHNGMANNEAVQAILGDMYENRLDWSEFVKNWPKISSAMMQLKEDYQDLLVAYKDEIKAYHKGEKGML